MRQGLKRLLTISRGRNGTETAGVNLVQMITSRFLNITDQRNITVSASLPW